MPFVKGVLAAGGDRDLAAAAQLLHRLCFDRVVLDTPTLPHEPRWSCQCKPCAAVWVAAKSGSVVRIDLDTSSGRPVETWTSGHSEARTIYHVHDGAALGGGPILLIGRDNGALEISSERGSATRFHLDSWWASEDRESEIAVDRGFDLGPHDGKPYTLGVTAIELVSRPDHPGALDILVATRSLWLYVIEAAGGALRLKRRLAMPGWVQWIVRRAEPDDVRITCISRGGDILELSHNALRTGGAVDPPRPTALSLLPTAAMPFDDGLLLGTTTGLFVVHDGHPVTVPVTRSPVLCLDRARVKSDRDEHDYIVLGLEDGNLRIVDAELIRALVAGEPRPTAHHHNFTVEMGSAVLAVETLQPSEPPGDHAYVIAVLRDHSMRLFEVTSQHTVRERVRRLWQQRFAGSPAAGPTRVAAELAAANNRDRDFDRDAWKYMVIDVVLPDLRRLAPGDLDVQRQIVELASNLAAGADRLVLHRLSVGLGELAANDVGLMLELSRRVLAAVPYDDDRRWGTFIDRHLRELNALTRAAPAAECARFVTWTRFVRKYLLLGSTFAAKQIRLVELVEQNFAAEKYLDALIYQARLSQQRYDLRWSTEVDGEVAALHVVDGGAGPAVAVVITVDGRLAFVEAATGRTIDVHSGGKRRKACAPFGDVQTEASTVARGGALLRVVLSCSGPAAPPHGLAVFDVRWSDERFEELTSELFEVACSDPLARASSVQPLPGQPDGFVVGLQTPSAPVGLLSRGDKAWRLDLASDPATDEADAARAFKLEPRSLAPGKVPTRALAVEIDVDHPAARYLVVTGSDDGLVRAISFAWGEPAARWQIDRWDRVADAVSCVALGVHPPPAEPDPDASLFSCYVGTATGDIFALSIFARDSSDAGPTLTPFGRYDAQPLWRDTHDGPILGVQLWRTPLFLSDRVGPAPRVPAEADEDVLVVVTEKGRLAVYKHSLVLDKTRTSALNNHFFRGMRFDRLAMPGRLHALTMLADQRELVAAGPSVQRDGTRSSTSQLYMARLVYLRNADDRIDPDPRTPDPRTPFGELPRDLPGDKWGRMHSLSVASVLDAPFELPPGQRYERKLDLWELIRLEGGALSGYALNERLSFHEPWELSCDPAAIAGRAHALLHPLDPENPQDGERIKIILKSLCRTHLFCDPGQLTTELLAGQREAPHPHAAAAVKVVADYLTGALAYASSAAARMRIVAIKELLRVPVLHHMAREGQHKAIQRDIARALHSCLRDDNRLVRIEALRAVSVMLRNVGVMADTAADRPRLIAALFPDGLGSLTWLLELIVTGLQLFPSFTRRTALVSGAWYHISALLHVFRIFPDHTLALCDYLVRNGLGVEPLAMCFRSLRGPRATTIRHRIGHLYLIPAVEPMHARDEYIEHYDRAKPGHAALVDDLGLAPRAQPITAPWHQIDDAAMAGRLFELLHRLARMWDVRDRRQIDREMASFQPTAARDSPLAALERVVADLSSVATALIQRKPDEVAALDRLSELDRQHGPGLTAPQRTIVSGIITAWRDVYNPPLPAAQGLVIGEYTLGAPLPEGGLASVFQLAAPRDKRNRCVIKVLRQWNAPHAAARFLEGARFNKELCEQSDDQKYIAEVVDIPPHGAGQPHLAYVMTKYDDSLEGYLRKELHKDGPKALRWAVHVAQHIGRALRAAHDRGRWHGDVKPSNILVDTSGEDPVFRLGDFALAGPDGGDGPIGIAPRCLSERAVQHGVVRRGAWGDLAALSVVLYQMLTGKAIDRGAKNLREHVVGLRELAATARLRRNIGALRVVETLIRVFQDGEPPIDVHELLASLDRKRAARPTPGEAVSAGSVDVGILTIRDDEFGAVLDRFPDAGLRVGRRRYRIRRLDLGDGQAYTVAVVCCGEQGNTSALDTARDLLDDLDPRLLLVVGIAGGVPHDEFSLGDVVVSNRIIDLSVEAVLKDHTRTYAVSGGALHRAATDLVADLPAMIHGGELDGWNLSDSITVDRPAVDLAKRNLYGPKQWKARVLESLHRHFVAAPRPPRVTAGAIASSDRLVKESETLDLWMKIARQIRAVEMESAGVYKAALGRVPFLAIRGISDIVGFNRDPAWTLYACHTAAAFTRAFLRARPLTTA